jgi:hypothetical protein
MTNKSGIEKTIFIKRVDIPTKVAVAASGCVPTTMTGAVASIAVAAAAVAGALSAVTSSIAAVAWTVAIAPAVAVSTTVVVCDSHQG